MFVRMSGRCKIVFTNLPLVAYRRCQNISDILVRAKLPEPIGQSRSPSGSFRCNKTSCTACPFIEDDRNQYTFYSTGQTFKIKCNLQYIGETKRRLKDRFNEHRRPIINPFCSYTPTGVSWHFLTSGHAEHHLILIPLEQLHTSRDSIRKAREAFLIHRGNTLEPAGLNRSIIFPLFYAFPFLFILHIT